MLGIIGLILKIILWIILGLLSLILLILLVVLFVPIRYRVDLSKPVEGELHVKGRATWLLWLLRIIITYDNSLAYKVKLLFFTVKDSTKPSKEEKAKENKTVEKNKSTKERQTGDLQHDDKTSHKDDLKVVYESKADSAAKDESDIKDIGDETDAKPRIDKTDEDIEVKDITVGESVEKSINSTTIHEPEHVIKTVILEGPKLEEIQKSDISLTKEERKAKNILEDEALLSKDFKSSGNEESKKKKNAKSGNKKKNKEKSKGSDQKNGPGIIARIKEGYQKYKPLWDDERYDGVLKFVLSNVLKIIKSILPRKLRADVIFGTGDPATTGYIIGGISMFYGVIGNSIKVVPDFHEKHFEGEIYAKGRVFLFVLLYHGIRTYMDRRVRAVIKLFKS